MIEPWEQEELRQIAAERERRRWLKGCPWCNVCDNQIEDAHCYVLDPKDKMGSCICEACVKVEIEKMRKAKINRYVTETVEEYFYEHLTVTPHEV